MYPTSLRPHRRAGEESLDRPFVVERRDELRDLIAALADQFATSTWRNAPYH
jgi:hypothetical protein